MNEKSVSPDGAEVRLLILCARTKISPEHETEIRRLVGTELDWAAFVDAAAAHGVLPLVCHQVFAICGEAIPANWHAQMRQRFEETAQRNLYLTAEMFRLANLLRSEGMFAVPYKGPLLAAQVYGDLALRQFADLDFAIRQKDLPRAATALIANGYKPAFGTIASDEGTRPTHSEYQFVRSEGNVVVEMQTEVTLRYFPQKLDFDALEIRLITVSIAGGEILSFSPEDTLILLAVHGAKHFWERLLWIADIAELCQAPPGMDWPAVFSRAEEMGVSRMVNLALYVAHRMLEAPLPDDVLDRVMRDAVAKKLGNQICEQFSMNASAQLPVFARFRFRVASRDSFWAGMRFAMRLATSPTEPDRAAVPLPEKFSGMRRWLRPVLLMRRHGIHKQKKDEPR
jgi:hypothetical protein